MLGEVLALASALFLGLSSALVKNLARRLHADIHNCTQVEYAGHRGNLELDRSPICCTYNHHLVARKDHQGGGGGNVRVFRGCNLDLYITIQAAPKPILEVLQ